MTEEKFIRLSKDCGMYAIHYDNLDKSDVYIEYTEHSPDPWYMSTETSIDIDKETATKIVEMLKEAFKI